MLFFNKISQQSFLDQYWQKKSYLIPQAFKNIDLPFDAGDLAGLAMDTDAPTRLMIEHDKEDWEIKTAPFEESDFTSLPDTHWTLLVNDIERYFPSLKKFIKPFQFIPHWRMDDLMISYAPDKGSVGPHLDQYDVFLIQVSGKRRWKLITHNDYPKAMVKDCPLALLQEFKADQEYLLEAGDILYLPPNLPHYGIAEGECMTLSVGFRSPCIQDLMQDWLTSFEDNPDFKKRYADNRRLAQTHTGEISQPDMQNLLNWMEQAIEQQKAGLTLWLGQHLSQACLDQEPEINPNLNFNPDTHYQRLAGIRFNYYQAEQQLYFFAQGEHFKCDLNLLKALQFLSQQQQYSCNELQPFIQQSDFIILFNQLLKAGFIYEN